MASISSLIGVVDHSCLDGDFGEASEFPQLNFPRHTYELKFQSHSLFVAGLALARTYFSKNSLAYLKVEVLGQSVTWSICLYLICTIICPSGFFSYRIAHFL